MSKMKITLILLAVTMSITGLNGQKDQAVNRETNESLNEGRYEAESLNNLDLEDPTRIVIRQKKETRHIPITRRGRRVSNKSSVWNRNWALDRYYPRRGTDNFVNVYVGLNNWLIDGDLPKSDELFSLSPINSWYLGVNFDNITKVIGPIYLDWGVGISFMNFAFENTRVMVTREDVGNPSQVFLTEIADISGRVSKLRVTHLNIHFVPTITLGRYNSFRVGLGVYGGYRIGSSSRMKFDDINGDKQKDTVKDSFHINPFRYGIRGQVGWDFFDLFVTYDTTDFFDEDAIAPRLTPITVGVIF